MARTAAVILDVDGTLIDSNDAHAHAWVDVTYLEQADYERIVAERRKAREEVTSGLGRSNLQARHGREHAHEIVANRLVLCCSAGEPAGRLFEPRAQHRLTVAGCPQ